MDGLLVVVGLNVCLFMPYYMKWDKPQTRIYAQQVDTVSKFKSLVDNKPNFLPTGIPLFIDGKFVKYLER